MRGRRRRQSGNPLTDYSFDRGQDLHSVGAVVEDHITFDVGDELIITAKIVFDGGRAVLNLMEVVELVDGEPHRRKYSYGIFINQTAFRYDRDPVHEDMPEHKHLTDGRRVRWGRVTLQEVVDEVVDLMGQDPGE